MQNSKRVLIPSKAGKVYSADEIDAALAKEFGI